MQYLALIIEPKKDSVCDAHLGLDFTPSSVSLLCILIQQNGMAD
jgi:hypothetical protein